MPRQPVAPRLRDRIRGQRTILGRRKPIQRHRPIRRHRIRIQQHMRLAAEALLPEQDILVLQPFVVRIEVPLPTLRRSRIALKLVQPHQPGMHRRAHRYRRKITLRQGVLGIDPRLHLRRVDALHPPVRIVDLRAKIIVHLIDGVGGGISGRLASVIDTAMRVAVKIAERKPGREVRIVLSYRTGMPSVPKRAGERGKPLQPYANTTQSPEA